MDKGRAKQMTAKEYLNYVRSIDNRLKIQEERIGQLEKDICSIKALDYTKDKVTGGRPIDISGKIARLDELIRRASEDWDILIKERERAKLLIEELESPKQQALLTNRYIQNEKWEAIAVELNITWPSTHRLHHRALKNLQKHLGGGTKMLPS